MLAIEAKLDLHRPYIRLCISYRGLKNYHMALLTFIKGSDIPEADSDIRKHITRTLNEFTETTKE